MRRWVNEAVGRRGGGWRLLAALALLGVVVGCSTPDPKVRYNLRLAGAQIPVELVESWLADAPDVRFVTERVQPVAWSEAGLRHLQRGECDLACTDRPLTAREVGKFGDRAIVGHRVGFYGFAFYVHPDNPTDSIYAGHIKLLFRKQINDWRELGPFEGPIRLIGPEKATRGGEILMRQARIWFADATWETRPDDRSIVAAVAADPLALGFAGIGLDGPGARYLGLRMERHGEPAWPAIEDIESERYGLAKVIYVYTADPPGPAAQAAIDYLYGDDARRVMQRTQVWQIPRSRGEVQPVP